MVYINNVTDTTAVAATGSCDSEAEGQLRHFLGVGGRKGVILLALHLKS